MAIRSLSTASIATGSKRSKFWDQSAVIIPPGTYESIATITVGAGGSNFIDFTGIPQTYKHLELRCSGKTTSDATSINVRVNGDSGASYWFYQMYGEGTGTPGSGGSALVAMQLGMFGTFSGAMIASFPDYSNTNKHKVGMGYSGTTITNGGYSLARGGLWQNTLGIESLTIIPVTGNFVQHSSFALYGIRG